MTHEERFDRIDANMERLNDSVAEVRDSLRQSVAEVRDSIRKLTEYVLDFRQETAQHFEVVDNRLEMLIATVASVELRIQPVTKAILDFGKVSTQVTNDQFRNKHATTELAGRMDRLEEKVSKLIDPAA
jgi:methyl-accepting chemotaxis protein